MEKDNNVICTIADVFEIFKDYLTRSDMIASNLLAKISSTILKKRIDLKMTQKEFAEKLEVSQAMISKWENTNYNFSIETLAKICDKLDLDVDITITERKDHPQYHNTSAEWDIQLKEDESNKKHDSNSNIYLLPECA